MGPLAAQCHRDVISAHPNNNKTKETYVIRETCRAIAVTLLLLCDKDLCSANNAIFLSSCRKAGRGVSMVERSYTEGDTGTTENSGKTSLSCCHFNVVTSP